MPKNKPKIRTLTSRQKEILTFVIEFTEKNSYPPSIREIGDAFEIKSTNGVFDHINALVRKEYIHREYFTARSITVLRKTDGSVYETKLETDVRTLLKKLEEFELSPEVKKIADRVRKQLPKG